jgi:hypothetical protein
MGRYNQPAPAANHHPDAGRPVAGRAGVANPFTRFAMTHVRHLVLALGVVVGVSVPVRADDAADARAIVEKAIKAQGGLEKLSKFKAHSIKFKGDFHGMGQAIPMTGEITTQGNDKVKLDAEVEAGGMKFRVINVLAGDKGWNKVGDMLMDLDKDQIAEAREQAYAGWLATLVPLLDKGIKLSTIGESEIENKPAMGVKVKSEGHRDVDLYFDKASGLLVKFEHRVKDEGSGQEVTEENFSSNYKDVEGTKQPMKFLAKRDGKLFLEGEITEYLLLEKVDENTFAKP